MRHLRVCFRFVFSVVVVVSRVVCLSFDASMLSGPLFASVTCLATWFDSIQSNGTRNARHTHLFVHSPLSGVCVLLSFSILLFFAEALMLPLSAVVVPRTYIAFYSHQNNVIIEFHNAFLLLFLCGYSFFIIHFVCHAHTDAQPPPPSTSSCEDLNRSCHLRLTCATKWCHCSRHVTSDDRSRVACTIVAVSVCVVGDGFRSYKTRKNPPNNVSNCYCYVFASGRRRNEPMPVIIGVFLLYLCPLCRRHK